jgi:hypothetical protein
MRALQCRTAEDCPKANPRTFLNRLAPVLMIRVRLVIMAEEIMDSDRFDALIRGIGEGASRRGVVRAGIGAMALTALVTLGLRIDDTEAKGRKKKKKKKRKKNKGVATATCSGARPITCGSGCCPPNLPKCCQDLFFAASPDTCNPNSLNCCPNGLGSCGPEFTKCCPATAQDPNGACTNTGGTCCPTALGGLPCDAPFSVCCLDDPADLESGYCCGTGETCCQKDPDCETGEECDFGCCVPTVMREAPGAARQARIPQSRHARFVHLAE